MSIQATHPEKLILASASPRRRELLTRLGLRFEVIPTDVPEDNDPRNGPAEMVAANAGLKATALSAQFADALVLGSDTTVALDGEVLNKPTDMDEAYAMLRRLSGRCHTVYTAVALIWSAGNFQQVLVESSKVRFKALGDKVIQEYFRLVNPLDKAGAYGIQQGREMIIESVVGSVENVMGLPVQALEGLLVEHGFDFKV
ncbi:MAG: Maf family protein [Opitutales bacterium]